MKIKIKVPLKIKSKYSRDAVYAEDNPGEIYETQEDTISEQHGYVRVKGKDGSGYMSKLFPKDWVQELQECSKCVEILDLLNQNWFKDGPSKLCDKCYKKKDPAEEYMLKEWNFEKPQGPTENCFGYHSMVSAHRAGQEFGNVPISASTESQIPTTESKIDSANLWLRNYIIKASHEGSDTWWDYNMTDAFRAGVRYERSQHFPQETCGNAFKNETLDIPRSNHSIFEMGWKACLKTFNLKEDN